MLKFQLENLDGLDDAVKALYVEKDGKFQLGIEGLPEDKSAEYETRFTAMDSKIKELLGEKKSEAEKRKAAEKAADEATRKEAEEAAKKAGDIEALEKSWQEKHDKTIADLKGEYEPKIGELQNLLNHSTVTATATGIAAEIGVQGSSKALMPHIESRLAMEVRDGKAVTVVRSLDGKPSATTIDELKQEFTNDPAFAPLIVGTKASGGGASGSDSGGAAKTVSSGDSEAFGQNLEGIANGTVQVVE